MYIKMKLINLRAGALVLGLGLTPYVHAGADQNPPEAGPEQGGEIQEGEAINSAEFLQKIHANNLAEIEMGRIIKERSSNVELQRYGHILVRDHLLMDGMVKVVAKTLNVELDAEAVNSDVAAFKESLAEMNEMLAQTSDEDFVETLRTHALDSHQAALALLNQAQQGAPELQVRILAKTSEPVIKRHLNLAERL